MKRWLLVLTCLLSIKASASLLAEPTKFEYTLDPLAKTTGAIKVTNITETPLLITAKAYDWILKEDGSLENLPLGSHQTTLSGNLKFNPKQFNLAPGQTQIVRFTVTMPDQPPKERRTMVFFETEEVTLAGGIKTIMQTQIGTVIYVTASKAKASFQLLDIKEVAEDSQLNFYLLCLNSGEFHIRISLTYAVLDLLGQELFKNTIEDNMLLPQQKSVLKLPIEENFQPGIYKLVGKFTFDGTHTFLPFVYSFTIDNPIEGGL